MKLTALDGLLWALGFLSTAVVLAALLLRARWRQFPLFTVWVAYVIGKSVLFYVILRFSGPGHLYAHVYWYGMWPEFVIEVAVAVELACIVFRRDGNWSADAKRLFLSASFCGFVVSALLSAWIVPAQGPYKAWELRGDLFTSLVICELLVSISLIANWLRLAWERHALAVAEGLTVWSAVSLVVNALESYWGTRYAHTLGHCQSYAWIAAMAWIAMEFALPNPKAEAPGPVPAGSSLRTSEIPPGVLRLLTGRLSGFQDVQPQPELGTYPMTCSEADSVDGVQP